jgi:hypothetical protein
VVENTAKGALYGGLTGLLLRRPKFFIILGMGVGAGMSYERCAMRFNLIQQRQQALTSKDQNDFGTRLTRAQILGFGRCD